MRFFPSAPGATGKSEIIIKSNQIGILYVFTKKGKTQNID
jgi:hypothetical protein